MLELLLVGDTSDAKDLDAALERSGSGDAEAFGNVVLATASRLYRLAVRMMGSTADAEDVLQEAYVRAFDAARARRFDRRSSVETWLYRIVTNAALDALRRKSRSQAALRTAGWTESDEGRPMDAKLRLRELADWLDELPPEQRAVLVLKELEGLSGAALAEVLGCTEGAAEQRLMRARTALRARSERG